MWEPGAAAASREGARRKGTGGGGGGEADRQTITRRLPLTLPLLIAIQRTRCGLVNPLDVNCLAYTNSVQMAARTALVCHRTDADDAADQHRGRANYWRRKHDFGPHGVPDKHHLLVWRPDGPPRPASPCEAPPRCPHRRPFPPPPPAAPSGPPSPGPHQNSSLATEDIDGIPRRDETTTEYIGRLEAAPRPLNDLK